MKISNQQVQRMLHAYAAEKLKAAAQQREKAKGISEPKDKIELSELAQQLARLRKDADKPYIREEKVEELRRKIKDGSYAPDLKEVAEAIIKEYILDRMAAGEGKNRG